MSEVAFVHQTEVPVDLKKDFVTDWWFLTTALGAPDATLHMIEEIRVPNSPWLNTCKFTQLVIWPSMEEAERFFTHTLVYNADANRAFARYKKYTQPREQVSLAELLRYRRELPEPIRTIGGSAGLTPSG